MGQLSGKQSVILAIVVTVKFLVLSNASQIVMTGSADRDGLGDLEFSQDWICLGPFRSGTREVSWGADPLEQYGGFRNLSYDTNANFRSALGEAGLVSWSKISADIESNRTDSRAQIDVQFPKINWNLLRSIYGWSALQHQGWIRGTLENSHNTNRRVSLYTDGVLELWVNGQHYWGGDFYTFRRAPIVTTLQPGSNQIDCRLIHDIRAMGGTEPPTVSILLEARIATESLYVDEGSAIVPDIVAGKLPSRYASIICRNEDDGDLEIVSLDATSARIQMLSDRALWFMKGQSRSVAFAVEPKSEDGTWRMNSEDRVSFMLTLKYRLTSHQPQMLHQQTITLALQSRSIFEPHKFTFLHPSGSVSYAILRPPSQNASEGNRTIFPVMLNLHGAGLEADSYDVRHMLDEVPDITAWTLFPEGMSPWSGDDWHTWGFGDVKAAIDAVPSWLTATDWKGPGVDVHKWFVSGHSNGGQGSWFILTHQPDKIIAATPVSGYTSIQNYVPYSMWQEADPRASFILQSALVSFRHELLVPNFDGIPIVQQHGSADDNVPAYHSRLMSELLAHSHLPSTYVELPDKGHWYEGILTTETLKHFYDEQLRGAESNEGRLPKSFTIVVPHTHDMGCRGGLCVDQLETPDVLGRLHVSREDDQVWKVTTSNIHRFHVDTTGIDGRTLVIDGKEFEDRQLAGRVTWLVKSSGSAWMISSDSSWRSLTQRVGRQIGAMDAILRTASAFTVWCSDSGLNLALQISQNLLQYFGADSRIMLNNAQSTVEACSVGNEIVIIEGRNVPQSALVNFPLQVNDHSIKLRLSDGDTRVFKKGSSPGAIFLRPLPNERLELVIWGADSDGLREAGRLVPMLTGVGQPDFVILGPDVKWKGHGAVLAMGFFDYQWNVSKASFIK